MAHKHKLVDHHRTITLEIKLYEKYISSFFHNRRTVIYNYLGTLDLYKVYVQYDYCIKILDLDKLLW